MPLSSARFVPVLATLGYAVACGPNSAPPSAPVAQPPAAALPTRVAAAASATPPSATAPTAVPTTDQPNQPPPASSDQETFPSGLVVDSKLLGGPAPGPELPKGTRILQVGDSFAGALGIELNKVFAAAGIKSRLEFEKSTYIPTWAHSAKLSGLLTSFKPDLVLVSLGSNELENPEPEKRAPLIQKLVRSFGATPCVWIAPVLWAGAKPALLEVIRANVGNCIYLDSNALIKKMPRTGDKIHPSMAARPDWAALTARWLALHRKPTEQQPWSLGAAP